MGLAAAMDLPSLVRCRRKLDSSCLKADCLTVWTFLPSRFILVFLAEHRFRRRGERVSRAANCLQLVACNCIKLDSGFPPLTWVE